MEEQNEALLPEEEETNDHVIPKNIIDEMQKSYLTYAMSVIVSRALPDVRDGLKPVHRRILYSMHEQGLRHNTKYKKSAKVVGEVLGKYHPHGDSAVYESMVRLAQDFSLRYPLIQGQGNFGSIDGDSAAAMRYTEARMQTISDYMLMDIEKETVDFRENYDASEQEPVVLPTRIPQLLLNGVEGIAVGMATKIPPHNLGEIVDGLMHLVDNPEATVEDLMEFIKGPDFPTGGIIHGTDGIKDAFMSGKGRIVVRGKAKIEEMKNGKQVIIIDEIPYQVNKALLIEKIATLVQNKTIVGITDVRDESDKDGLRVVVELKKDSYPKKILNQLFKFTQLQNSFNVNMIALVDGIQPRLLNLKSVLEYFIAHRKEVVIKRTEYELKVAKARAHILEGLKIALDHIDEIITTIRNSETKEEAKTALIKNFELTELQAKAILEMRLQALAGLERQKVLDELAEKMALIKELEGILADESKILNIIKAEFIEVKEKFNDERRTEIRQQGLGDFSNEDLIPNEPMIITLTKSNYIKRVPITTYRAQNRGGRGIAGMQTKEEDTVEHIQPAMTHDEILFFTNKGRVFKLKVYELTQAGRTAKGDPLVNFLQLGPDEKVTAMMKSSKEPEDRFVFMCTEQGTVKKTKKEDFKNVRANGLIAIKLRDGDTLRWVRYTSGEDDIFVVTEQGQSIHFKEDNVRSMGRASTGVRGIKLKDKDIVVQMLTLNSDITDVIFVSRKGYGKRTKVQAFKVQHRGGSGIIAFKVTPKTGRLVGARVLNGQELKTRDLIIISEHGQVMRTQVKNTPSLGRATQGVILMRLKKDYVSSFATYQEEEIEEEKPTPKPKTKDTKSQKEEKNTAQTPLL